VLIVKSHSHSARSRLLFGSVGALLVAAGVGTMGTAGWAAAPKLTDSPIRGVVRAVQQASISTDLTTRVAAVHVREGDAFKTGEKLVEFDCRRQLATVAASDAQQLEMQLTVDKNKLLLRSQSVGKNDLEVSEARLTKAKAEADALRSQLDQCTVIAPFNGRVHELILQVHETSQPGKPFIGLVANEKLEIDLIVPSHWLRRLPVGAAFTFRVDEAQQSVKATVSRTGAVVDPVSQTIKIIATFSNEGQLVLPGMSGTAELVPDGE
jgi:membrane fusion protein, multidrug efflux system